jgi:hypothetical protein
LTPLFRATLEEIQDATLVMHVVDASHVNSDAQSSAVLKVRRLAPPRPARSALLPQHCAPTLCAAQHVRHKTLTSPPHTRTPWAGAGGDRRTEHPGADRLEQAGRERGRRAHARPGAPAARDLLHLGPQRRWAARPAAGHQQQAAGGYGAGGRVGRAAAGAVPGGCVCGWVQRQLPSSLPPPP